MRVRVHWGGFKQAFPPQLITHHPSPFAFFGRGSAAACAGLMEPSHLIDLPAFSTSLYPSPWLLLLSLGA